MVIHRHPETREARTHFMKTSADRQTPVDLSSCSGLERDLIRLFSVFNFRELERVIFPLRILVTGRSPVCDCGPDIGSG